MRPARRQRGGVERRSSDHHHLGLVVTRVERSVERRELLDAFHSRHPTGDHNVPPAGEGAAD